MVDNLNEFSAMLPMLSVRDLDYLYQVYISTQHGDNRMTDMHRGLVSEVGLAQELLRAARNLEPANVVRQVGRGGKGRKRHYRRNKRKTYKRGY